MARTRRAPDDDVRRPDDDDAPVRKARRRDEDDDDEEGGDDEPLAPRKKKKSAAGPVKLVLRIVGGVAGAILLVLLLYWIYSPVGTDYALLCYLPKETSRITGYDVDDASRNGKLKEVHETVLNNYRPFYERRFSTESGVTVADVSKFLSGVAGSPDEDRDLRPQDKRGSVTVIRFRNAVDQNKFLGSFTGAFRVREKQSRDGKTFHQLYRVVRVPPDWHEEEEDDISFFFPNSKTLVYTSTRRECEEALTRQSGRVVVTGDMRELADKVDGTYFQASSSGVQVGNVADTMAFGLGVVDPELRDQQNYSGKTGSGSWFASNGNDFLYASAVLYSDTQTARKVRSQLKASIEKAQAEIWQGDSGMPSGLEDPFNPKQGKNQPGGFGGGGGGGWGAADSETTKDILEALAEYIKNARVYNRGRLVVFEGTISHGTPEQGVFEKFWRAVGGKFQASQGGAFPGMGPGMMGPGGPPPGMVMPGRPPG